MNSTPVPRPRGRVRKWVGRIFLVLLLLLTVFFAQQWFIGPAPPNLRPSGQTMKAVVNHEYGGADILRYEDTIRPLPNDNQVLIRVRAASANPVDWHYMRGTPYAMRLMGSGLRKPADPRVGTDVAGVVVEVGKDVTKFKVGDEIFGTSGGAFAEFAPVTETKAVLKPANLTFEQAAGVPVAALTALQSLRDEGHLSAGQKVLINGASGGVGTFGVQIAKILGAEVTAVCSTRNVELVRSLGADHVVDYTKQDVTLGEAQYDLVIDNVGTRGLSEFRRVMKPGAQFVLIGGGGPDAGTWIGPMWGPVKALFYSPFVSQSFVMMISSINETDLTQLREWLEAGKLKVVIDRAYPLSETATAIRYLETGRARGKVIITVPEPIP